MLALWLLATAFISTNIFAKEKTLRWPDKKKELANINLAFTTKNNIFGDYHWTSPDITSHLLTFTDGKASIDFGGANYHLELKGNQLMVTYPNSTNYTATKQVSNQYYYSLHQLKLKTVWTMRNVPTTSYRMVSVPVMRTRPVTHYVYNSGTHTSQPVYSSESYTTYEYRSEPYTTWHYVSSPSYVLDIPNYNIFLLKLEDGHEIVVYEIDDNGTKKYYYQNPGYLIGTDEKGTKYVISDANSNGSYFDADDQMMFNTWNPYQEGSTYRSVSFFKENKWVRLDELKNNLFMEVTKGEGNTVSFRNENDMYVGNKDEGTVTFVGLPDKCSVVINGRKYNVRAKHPQLASEYGKFKAVVTENGHLPVEVVYTIDKDHPSFELDYQQTPISGEVKLEDIYADNFYITVTNADGYMKQYSNTTDFFVPAGIVTLEIENAGYTLTKEVDVSAGLATINYADEVKKQLPEDKDADKANDDGKPEGK